ncbi:MAG: diacylglycerol kinase [Treponema sp.]|jgi:diacylglycerol kinase family enzyme|nr:diacylglycerol kinase [Treponema sp.]
MDLDYFTQSLDEICQYSLVSPGRPLACTVIANPVAGGFSIRSKWREHVKTLDEYREKAKQNPPRATSRKAETLVTEREGSVRKIIDALVEQAEKDPAAFHLVITAGGDGTHSETMFAVYNTLPHIRSNLAVLRLPFGTGNDGSDGVKLSQALDLLIKPVHVEFSPAVQLTTSPAGPASGKGLFLAFNILSVGLDAYVTHMTNKLKGKVSGDSYKLWLDVAALFYDKTYKVDFMDVRALDAQNREVLSFREKLLLLAMGVTGHRTYGSQQKILSDERNVCGVRQMPLHRKLLIKGLVKKGAHINHPEAIMLNAHRLEFKALHPILAQMDGETVLLQPEDFPASMELTAPVIPLLKAD